MINVYDPTSDVFLPNSSNNRLDQNININCSALNPCNPAPPTSTYSAKVSIAVRFDQDYLYVGYIVKDTASKRALLSIGGSNLNQQPYYICGTELFINTDISTKSSLPEDQNWPIGYNESKEIEMLFNILFIFQHLC